MPKIRLSFGPLHPIIRSMKNQNIRPKKIAIIGPRTTIGRCILGQLAQNNLPVTCICPLDIHQDAGQSVYYGTHRLLTQPIDSFDFKKRHIIFVCDKKIVPLLAHKTKKSFHYWIDCTHSVKDALCIIPSINGSVLNSACPKWICNPSSPVIALTHILCPILKSFNTQTISLTLLMGTVFEGQELSDSLFLQTRHFLTQTPLSKTHQTCNFAFNLIPDYFSDLAEIITHQMKCFISVPVTVRSCFVPVIRGSCIYVQLFFQKNYDAQRILKKLNALPHVRIIYSKQNIGLCDIATEDQIFIIHPVVQQKILSFWCLHDAIQQGLGINAVQLAKMLMK